MITGIYLGYVHKAGGMVGPDSYVVPLRQLDGLNMETGRTPEGKRPIIEKSDQVYSNLLDGTAKDQEPHFPLREAYEKAMTEVRSVTVPPTGLASSEEGSEHAAKPFSARDPALVMPPPPEEGEAAPQPDSEAEDDDDDGPGGCCWMMRLWSLTGGTHSETQDQTKT